jgi:hypothetical protein
VNSDLSLTVPLAVDVTWMLVVLLWVVSTGIAVLSIMRTRHDRVGAKAWWSVFVIAVPLVGALAWFWQRRPER